MSKNFAKSAEDQSLFLIHTATDEDENRKGERADTSPLRVARTIDIRRIQPDPNQPRKTFNQETLASLAESIKELGGIIDPITVEYIEKNDCFRIISGERRYRAAMIAGVEKLPCIIKEVDDEKRFLMQFIANLQREDITALEEAAGIRHLIENCGYTQQKVAMLFNKSKSHISQILGLERLSEDAKGIVQTSELSTEVQIQASRERDPKKQIEILNKASEEGKTIKQIRKEVKGVDPTKKKKIPPSDNRQFREWSWRPKDGRFDLTIRFNREYDEDNKSELVRNALQETMIRLQ
jgi:ParB family chromosome partitioning protein